MIKIQTALLAVALTTPFGLAIHDDLTRETPDPDQLAALNWAMDDQFGLDEAALDEYDKHADELAELQAAREAAEAAEAALMLGSDALRQLVGTERASLGPTLAPLRFGMTLDQVRAAVPRLYDWDLPDDDFARVSVLPEYLGKGDTQLTAVELEFFGHADETAAELRSLWGEPTMHSPEATIWIDADAGRRAALTGEGDSQHITFSQVMTVEALLGKPGDKGFFGFAGGKRVLGARLADLRGVIDGLWVDPYYGDYAVLQLPGVTVDPAARSTTKVMLSLDKGKVSAIELAFGCDQRCQDVLDALRARHGEPRATGDGDMIYGGSLAVRTRGEGDNATIEMSARPR